MFPTSSVRKEWKEQLGEEILYYQFVQFIFQKQWQELREYAHEHEVEIIGDIPIFVSLDSCDVWANKKLFQLDTKGYPTCVAGVPPDYFPPPDSCGAIPSTTGITTNPPDTAGGLSGSAVS